MDGCSGREGGFCWVIYWGFGDFFNKPLAGLHTLFLHHFNDHANCNL